MQLAPVLGHWQHQPETPEDVNKEAESSVSEGMVKEDS